MSTQPKKTPTVLERLDLVEESLGSLASFSQKELTLLKSRVLSVVEILNAVIKASGDGFEEKVQAELEKAQANRDQERIVREKALLESLVRAGAYAPAQKIGPLSLVVVREFNERGETLSDRVQAKFSQFGPEAQTALLDKEVGYVLDLPGGKLEVIEIYDLVPETK
ncbi:hypothetical protein [Myxococcus phage Mx1]|nr:hypothetical protein [Myxococcus phage Mx1]